MRLNLHLKAYLSLYSMNWNPFGIKVIVIESGGVGLTFLKNLKMASKSDSLKSLYRTMQNSISQYFNQWAQNLMHPSEVAVILQAGTKDNDRIITDMSNNSN
jgi:hypothetical protein